MRSLTKWDISFGVLSMSLYPLKLICTSVWCCILEFVMLVVTVLRMEFTLCGFVMLWSLFGCQMLGFPFFVLINFPILETCFSFYACMDHLIWLLCSLWRCGVFGRGETGWGKGRKLRVLRWCCFKLQSYCRSIRMCRWCLLKWLFRVWTCVGSHLIRVFIK